MAAPDAKHPRPNGLTNLGDVLMERIELGSLVNVIGFVADFQAPRKTNGSGTARPSSSWSGFVD
jgi:hypothetical protein